MLTASVSNSDSSRAAENREDLPTHSNVISDLEKIASRASIGDFVYIDFALHWKGCVMPSLPRNPPIRPRWTRDLNTSLSSVQSLYVVELKLSLRTPLARQTH